MQSSPSSLAKETKESEELARFREAWKEEVRRKKGQPSATTSEPDHRELTGPIAAGDGQHAPVRRPSVSTALATAPRAAPDAPSKLPLVDASIAPLGTVLSKAVEVYRRAVQCEQKSDLDEALRLYRMAFRLDANVDRAYHKLEMQLHAAGASGSVQDAPAAQAGRSRHGKTVSVSSNKHDAEADEPAALKTVVTAPASVPVTRVGPGGHTLVSGTLASLLAMWPHDISFEPEDEREPVPLNKLPDELLVLVLRHLDTAAIERFATVNRKARAVSLDTTIWRDFVYSIYKPPQIPDDDDVGLLLRAYLEDHRRMYIEHPRVRLDGVYIAVCHYIRAGLSENAWVNVSHLITYHRYLRFYPNGQVLSLLANEEMPPQQVIPLLKPTLRMKGLFIGNWVLDGTTVHIADLLDPSGTARRYAFQMLLELRSRPLGRWNRLDFREYDSVEIASGEATPLGLKHERPFWFSRVRSYAQ